MADFVLGVDPGKDGAFVLINDAEQIVGTWDMPYIGRTLSAVKTAEIYQEVVKLVRDQDLNKEIHVFIEKAFTMPTDALSMEQWREVKRLHQDAKNLCSAFANHQSGIQVPKSEFNGLFGELGDRVKYTDWLPTTGYRPDGRVGNFYYAKNAGVLEICAAYGLSYDLVHPTSWCKRMHNGADSALKAKDRSRQVIERRWPEYAKKGSQLWKARGRKMHEGRMDAFLIAIDGLRELRVKS